MRIAFIMMVISAKRNVSRPTRIISLLVKQGDVFSLGRKRNRFQVGGNVRQVLIGYCFACVGRHLGRGMTDVTYERFERKLRRTDAGGAGLCRALALKTVAFVAAIAREILLAVLRIARRRSVRSGLVWPRQRARENQRRNNDKESEPARYSESAFVHHTRARSPFTKFLQVNLLIVAA